MSVDFRIREDAADQQDTIEINHFFAEDFSPALDNCTQDLQSGLAHLQFNNFIFEVDGKCWTLSWEPSGALCARAGTMAGAAHTRLSAEDLSGLIRDWYTPMTFFTGGTLDMVAGSLGDFLDAWLVLRAVLDNRPLYAPGLTRFEDRSGKPLNLQRSFTLQDDPADVAHFLEQAGFVHLQGFFSAPMMAEISRDMDAAMPCYTDGDGKSWWADTANGDRRVVRMQSFDQHSAATAELLASEHFQALGDLTGDHHCHQGLQDNRIEALVKPLNVVRGISDLPWHKDCSLGRHSYDCCSLTAGISVTGADADSGQLRVLAGSHRHLMWPAMINPNHYDLPDIALPTEVGDVTIHLSCTAHMAQAPITLERRVMYTGFRLPARNAEAAAKSQQRISAVREGAYTTVSQ